MGVSVGVKLSYVWVIEGLVPRVVDVFDCCVFIALCDDAVAVFPATFSLYPVGSSLYFFR